MKILAVRAHEYDYQARVSFQTTWMRYVSLLMCADGGGYDDVILRTNAAAKGTRRMLVKMFLISNITYVPVEPTH